MMDVFICVVDNIPTFAKQLESVFIFTDPSTDMSRPSYLDVRAHLGRCNGLKELTFIVAGDL
jgi:hypothetical protein